VAGFACPPDPRLLDRSFDIVPLACWPARGFEGTPGAPKRGFIGPGIRPPLSQDWSPAMLISLPILEKNPAPRLRQSRPF